MRQRGERAASIIVASRRKTSGQLNFIRVKWDCCVRFSRFKKLDGDGAWLRYWLSAASTLIWWFVPDAFPFHGRPLVARSSRHPGEKVRTKPVTSRLGAKVTLLGCVGGDAFGLELLNGVAAQGVNVSAVRVVSGASSGVATITVCDGENTIVVAPGANHRLCPADIDAEKALFSADVILSQLEIPLECVVRVAELAASQGNR